MLNCENCQTKSICKIFEQKEKFNSIATISVENCKCYVGENNFAPAVDHNLGVILNRIENIKSVTKSRELKNKKTDELHFCEDCQENKKCFRCDVCGKWVCEDCATTTPDNKVLCVDCYNEE